MRNIKRDDSASLKIGKAFSTMLDKKYFILKKKWCERGDSNPYAGKAHDPEPCASASSATFALL